jgi:multiple sugar transport system permease protein
MRRPPARARQLRKRALGWGLGSPLFLVIVGLVFVPVVLGFRLSTQAYSYGIPGGYVGLQNYVDVLRDPTTLTAAVHTVGYTIVAVSIELLLGLTFALALNRPFRGRALVMAALVLPWALPSVVSGILWLRIFNPDNGLLNVVLMNLHILDAPKVWFSSQGWAIAFIAMIHAWGVVPLVTLILLAGLQGIPDEIYDASAVDGASGWQQFRLLTWPLLRPAIAVALTTGTVLAIAIFDEVYVLTGYQLNTYSLMMQAYQITFTNLQFGKGAAFAYLVTLATGIFAIGYVRGLRRAER